MNIEQKIDFIIAWIKNYTNDLKFQPVNLVIGVSGGIDSAVTSTLAAKTKLSVLCIHMPIYKNKEQLHSKSLEIHYSSGH